MKQKRLVVEPIEDSADDFHHYQLAFYQLEG